MKEKYDFGSKPEVVKRDIVTESVELKENYDFVTEANAWAQLGKGLTSVANTTYAHNALKGAGTGAVVGAGAGVVSNSLKRDDDPTKKGFFGSMASGATKGAGVGAAGGAALRFASRRGIGLVAIDKVNANALKTAKAEAKAAGKNAAEITKHVTDTAKYINSGEKGVVAHRYIGVNAKGNTAKAISNGSLRKVNYTNPHLYNGESINAVPTV